MCQRAEREKYGKVTTEANRDVVRRFYELMWNKGDVAQASKLIHPHCVRHDPSGPVPSGPEGFAAMAQKWRAAFSDLALVVDMMLAEGDLVAARWTITATHTGAFAGVPISFKSIRFSGVNIFRINDGQIAEIWNHRDDLSVMQQVGAIPPMPQR